MHNSEIVDVRPADAADRTALRCMLELYQYDLSDVWDQDLDDEGQYGYDLNGYWSNQNWSAFMFAVSGRHAGFALVNDSVTFPQNEFWMSQFFVLKKFRRQGVGAEAARSVFDFMRAKWEVGQMPLNATAHHFWRRVIDQYTGGNFAEHELNDDRWQGTLQCFDNSKNQL